MVNSRNKGAHGEREVIRLLNDHLGEGFSRNLKQYQEAQHGDIEAPEGFPFCVEVKFYKSGWTCRPEWVEQAFRAAEKVGKKPCIAYRFNGQGWRFRIWPFAGQHRQDFADVPPEVFCNIAREQWGESPDRLL